jgi:hypothetical protein
MITAGAMLRQFRLLGMGWMVRGSNPGGGGKRFSVLYTHPDLPWSPNSLLYNGYLVPFPRVKRLERGVYHPPPSGAEVENEWSSASTPLLCLPWQVTATHLPLPLISSRNTKSAVMLVVYFTTLFITETLALNAVKWIMIWDVCFVKWIS